MQTNASLQFRIDVPVTDPFEVESLTNVPAFVALDADEQLIFQTPIGGENGDSTGSTTSGSIAKRLVGFSRFTVLPPFRDGSAGEGPSGAK